MNKLVTPMVVLLLCLVPVPGRSVSLESVSRNISGWFHGEPREDQDGAGSGPARQEGQGRGRQAVGQAPGGQSASSADGPSLRQQQEKDQRFTKVWDQVIKRLDEGLEIVDEMGQVPDRAWFGTDKDDLREDLDDLLDDIILILQDHPIANSRARTRELEERIATLREDIVHFKEARVAAPEKHSFKTTRGQYEKKIARAEQEIVRAQQEIEAIRQELYQRIRAVGLDMSEDQVAVLLSRVDADDIIQMSAIFDITRQITDQLMRLTAESGEDIDIAKRYYGMYVVLLELLVRMQHNYIVKVDDKFLPRIGVVVDRTVNLKNESIQKLRLERDPRRREMYKKNIQAQDLTLRTARLYMRNLKDQRDRVRRAMAEMQRSLALAHNTYETVQVSAELLDILEQSDRSFESLMQLQIPEIVPFENAEMLRKYQELSRIISE